MYRKLYTPGRLFKRILADRNKIAIPLDGSAPNLGLKREVMLKGELFIEVVDDDTGEVVDEHRYNTLTDGFRSAVASLIVNGALGRPTKMRLGTGAFTQGSNYEMDYPTGTTAFNAVAAAYDHTIASTGANFGRAGGTFVSTDGINRRISRAMFWMRRVGAPTGTAYLELQVATSQLPSGAVLDTTSTVTLATIPTTYGWISFPFINLPTLNTGITWTVTLRTTGYTQDASNYVQMLLDATGITLNNFYTDPTAGVYAPGGFTNYSPVMRVVSEPDANYTDIYGLVTSGEKNFTSASNPASNQARMLSNYTTAEANDYIGHIGMFDAAGNLHAIAGVNFQKTSSQSVNVYWVVSVS